MSLSKPLMRKVGAACLVAGLFMTGPVSASDVPVLTFAGYSIAPDQVAGDTDRFGGISGLDYDPSTGLFWAISDARNVGGQGAVRGYRLRLVPGGPGAYSVTDIVRFDLPGAAAGAGFAPNAASPEGIRGLAGGYYWASEGECGVSQPTLWHVAANAKTSEPVPIRPEYHYAAGCKRKPEAGLAGAADNGALESLAISEDGATLLYANEFPLLQDPADGPERAVRITVRSLKEAGAPVRQYAYRVAAPFALTELLAIGGARFLALQRYYVRQSNATVARLALIDLAGATDIALVGVAPIPPQARAVQEVAELLSLNASRASNPDANLFGSGAPIDNLEGMALGCIGSEPMLVLAADDNFAKFGPQKNLFLMFKISGTALTCG